METLKSLLVKRFEYNSLLLKAQGKERQKIQKLADEINMKIIEMEG